MNFGAVILAGGRSQRIGCDKAWIQIEGQPLVARQVALAREAGAGEVFISGRRDGNYSRLGCQVLFDAFADAGPLAGMERALALVPHPLVLVLAVDMPDVTVGLLGRLAALCTPECGVVPAVGDRLEPLVGFYPRACHSLAVQSLRSGDGSPQRLAGLCVERGIMRRYETRPEEAALLRSWNTPADVPTHRAFMPPAAPSL